MQGKYPSLPPSAANTHTHTSAVCYLSLELSSARRLRGELPIFVSPELREASRRAAMQALPLRGRRVDGDRASEREAIFSEKYLVRDRRRSCSNSRQYVCARLLCFLFCFVLLLRVTLRRLKE